MQFSVDSLGDRCYASYDYLSLCWPAGMLLSSYSGRLAWDFMGPHGLRSTTPGDRDWKNSEAQGPSLLEARGTKERAPTRLVVFWLGKFYLENYNVNVL